MPSQDKGYLLVTFNCPIRRLWRYAGGDERGRTDCVGLRAWIIPRIAGQSFVLNAVSSNYGSMFVNLSPFHDRRGAELSGEAIIARLRERSQREIPEAQVLVLDLRR